MGAIVHTFFAGKFANKAKILEAASGESTIASRTYYWLGHVEAIFGLWLLPLMAAFVAFKGWDATKTYFVTRCYNEPIFVFVIMVIAATRPILFVAEGCIQRLVHLCGGERPSMWWLCILMVAPLFGSLMTEPAAMTIAALLLADKVFVYRPSVVFSYATLGLLFVNVSVGGALTNFAAPPILMVASPWGWSTRDVFTHFGVEAMVGILLSSLLYGLIFAKQLRTLNQRAKTDSVTVHGVQAIPLWMSGIHIAFLVWTVLNAHQPVLVVLGGLLFLVVVHIFKRYQAPVALKEALLVGCFLAGLVTHGGLQEWWIEAVLLRLNDVCLFYGAMFLTSFNDNASLTYLASLVPAFAQRADLQTAVVSGAIIGGGLTVIANAPNPAGQAILSKFFDRGIVKPLPLLLGASIPTLVLIFVFRYWMA
jgi:hypothetical protein